MIIFDSRPHSKETIITAIENHFTNIDSEDEVYIGITNDPDERLSKHRVDDEDNCLVFKSNSRKTAKDIEKYLLDHHPAVLGDTGGGTEDTVYIYAFEWDFDKHQ